MRILIETRDNYARHPRINGVELLISVQHAGKDYQISQIIEPTPASTLRYILNSVVDVIARSVEAEELEDGKNKNFFQKLL